MDQKKTKAKGSLRKNLLVLLVTLVMLISIIPSTAFAVDNGDGAAEQGSVVDTTGVDEGNANKASGGADEENTTPATPAGDATKVITLYAPDGAAVVSTVGVDDATAAVLGWTLPDYAVDASVYPDQTFAGWSDGVNLYPAGYVMQNLTADVSLTAALQGAAGAEAAVARAPRSGTHVITWNMPNGSQVTQSVAEGSTVAAAGGNTSPVLTSADDPSGNGGEFKGWFYDAGNGNLKQFYDNTTIMKAYSLEPIFGDLPANAQNAPAVQKSYLFDLVPNVSVDAENITSGVEYTASLTGSLSLPAGVWLEDVVFTFNVSSLNAAEQFVILMNNANPAAYGSFEIQMVNSYTLQLTVYRLESRTGGGSVEFGRFRYSAPNVLTPNNLQAQIELVSISSGGVTLEKSEWQSQSPAWSVQQTVTVGAKSGWTFGSSNSGSHSFTRTEGADTSGQIDWELPTNATSFNIRASESQTTTGYVRANGAKFQVKLSATAQLVLPASVKAAFATSTPLYDGTGTLNAAFAEYFALTDTAALAAAGWAANAQMVGDDLVITFENTNLLVNPQAAIKAFSAYFKIKKVSAVTPLDKTAAVTGRYVLSYVSGNDSYVTYSSIGATNDAEKAVITGNGSFTYTVTFAKPTSVSSSVDSYLAAASKAISPWYYSGTGYASTEAQYGDNAGTDPSRDFVSDGNYALPGTGNTINLDQIWFNWNLKNGGTVPITELVLSETEGGGTSGAGAGWNENHIMPVGFEIPVVETGTTAEIYVTIGGARYKIYNSAGSADSVPGFTTAGNYILYSGTGITKFEFVFTSATAVHITGNPRVMFKLKTGHGLSNNGYTTNGSYLSAKFITSGPTDVSTRNQSRNLTYKKVDLTPSGSKSVQNLTRSSGFRPGDLLKYTVSVDVVTILPAAYSHGLLVADVASEDIVLDPAEMNTQVVVTHGANSRKYVADVNNRMALSSLHGVAGTGSNNVYTYANVPSLNSSCTAVNSGALPKGTPPAANATDTVHYYGFTGLIYSGDIVTITYYARVSSTAGSDIVLTNKLFAHTNWTAPGGGGNGGAITWEDLGKGTTNGVSSDEIYGDIRVSVVPQDSVTGLPAATTHNYYLPGDNFYFDILGGLIESSKQVQNPVFLVQLPGNVQFASDELLDVQRMGITLDVVNSKRVIGSATNIAPSGYSIEWLADKGSGLEEVPYDEATHMRLTVSGTFGATATPNTYGELIGFKVQVKVVDVPVANSHFNNYNVKVGMSAQDGGKMTSIAINQLYDKRDPWPGRNSQQAPSWGTGVFDKALQYGNSAGTKYVYATDNVYVYSRASQASIDKTRGAYPTKPTTSQEQEGLYVNDTLEFTVKVSNVKHTNGGLNDLYNTPGSFHPGPIVDILPTGVQFVQGTAVASVDGVDVPVTVSTGATTAGNQRIVVTLNDSSYQLEYGKVFILKYTVKAVSIDHFIGQHMYTEDNVASVYVDPDYVRGVGNVEAAASDVAEWRDGVPAGDTFTRIYEKEPLTLKDKRIIPGIVKTAASNEMTMFNEAVVTWTLTVSNDTKADLPIEGYYVVDVLPKDFTFEGMTSGAAPQQYVNKNGQVVLVWNFGANDTLAIGGSLNLSYRAKALAFNDDGMLMVGYYTNTAYMQPKTQLFENSSIEKGTPVNATNTAYSNDLTLANGSTVIALGRAIVNHHTIKLTSKIGAIAENKVSYNGASTMSSTSYKLVETERDKTVDYSFELKNEGSLSFEDVRVFNTLPYAGDQYTMRSESRNSSFAMLLRDSVQFGVTLGGQPQSGFTVYYSSSAVHGRTGLMEDSNWVEASQWNWGKNGLPKSFRVDMPAGFTLKAGEKLLVTWQLVVPDDVLVETQTNPSYNSAGYYFAIGNSKYFAEPERVGVYIKDTGLSNLTVQVQKYLRDAEMREGEERDFLFRLERYNPTTYGYDPVHMDKQSGLVLTGINNLHVDGDPNSYGLFTIVAKNIATVTGSISKLPSGTYRVVELNPDKYNHLLYRYTVSGNSQEHYIGFVRGGSTIPSATYLIQNIYDGYYVPSDSSGGTRIPESSSGSSGSTTMTASSSGSGSGGLSTLTITPSQPPLIDPTPADTWALLNLICAIFSAGSGLLLLVLLLIRTLRKGKDEEDEAQEPVDEATDRNERRTNVIWRLVSALVGIASLVTFILTQDMRNDMVFVDKWTPLMLAFALVTIFSLISMWYSQRKRDEEDDDYYYSAT